ncbi:MAG: epoxyqueuosine reductase QueH [Oscillospiraceae bacterium]
MEQKINYQKALEKLILSLGENRPSLLLHACCAPCSSYVLDYLSSHFDITLFYYNPNITPKTEYDIRLAELHRLCEEMPLENAPRFLGANYDPKEFTAVSDGLEDLAEGGERCRACYRLRLEATAKAAAENGFEYFCTTLSISPYKNSVWLNEIGQELATKYAVEYLSSDFKKNDGYKKSIAFSRQYSLYRQNYCGCIFSRLQREKEEAQGHLQGENCQESHCGDANGT